MEQYHTLLKHILTKGSKKTDRTGTGTISTFGYQMRFDLSEGFPLVTTKKMFWKGMVYEMLWFLRGDTNVKYLQENGVHFWDSWADENGDLGPVYGKQLRAWNIYTPERIVTDDIWGGEIINSFSKNSIDQVAQVIEQIKINPDSRRHVMTTWNVADLPKMRLQPCHGNIVQFYVNDGKLSLQMYQRSGDCFLGVPVNIASYSLLLLMVAQVTGLQPGEFIHTIGDAHIYLNHIEQVNLQLTRDFKPLPQVKLNPTITDIDDFKFDDIELVGYDCWPGIKGAVAV